jgi:hypothetical protein
VVFDGVTQRPSMEVRQPVNEGGSENRDDEPRLLQVTDRCCDDGSGHDSARDHAFAVDHPERVAFGCPLGRSTAAFVRSHVPASQFPRAHVRIKHPTSILARVCLAGSLAGRSCRPCSVLAKGPKIRACFDRRVPSPALGG